MDAELKFIFGIGIAGLIAILLVAYMEADKSKTFANNGYVECYEHGEKLWKKQCK